MLKKVISGGQTGADIAGLIIARQFGLETGGWIPLGFLTQEGPRPEYVALYGMQEHSSKAYPPRTFANVRDSDGTIRLAFNFRSSGELCTLKAIQKYKKPYIDVGFPDPRSVDDVVQWILTNNIEILNVAGNAERTYRGMQSSARDYLRRVFIALGLKERT